MAFLGFSEAWQVDLSISDALVRAFGVLVALSQTLIGNAWLSFFLIVILYSHLSGGVEFIIIVVPVDFQSLGRSTPQVYQLRSQDVPKLVVVGLLTVHQPKDLLDEGSQRLEGLSAADHFSG